MDDPGKRKYEPAEQKEINHGRPSDRKEMKNGRPSPKGQKNG